MKGIPILAFTAYSGTGKTTLIEQVVQNLKDRGLRVAVIKHDGHDFEMDHRGKDSWRYTQAGADISIISSTSKTALMEQRPLSLTQAAAMIHDVDLILVEGYKDKPLTQIGLCRQMTGKDFTADISRYIAVVTDIAMKNLPVPCFGFDDVQGLTKFILRNMDHFTHINGQASYHRTAPSMDAWLKEAKADPSAEKIGMYLTHNGVVRKTAKAVVRDGSKTAGPVRGMMFSYNPTRVAVAIEATYKMEGIYYIRTWLNEGELQVGDDIMYVLIGGDIRPHVMDAIQYLVGRIKNECVTEIELQ